MIEEQFGGVLCKQGMGNESPIDSAITEYYLTTEAKVKMTYIIFFLLLFSSASYASSDECTTSINGAPLTIYYDGEFTESHDTFSWREVFMFWREFTCPAYVTLRHFTPDLSDSERSVFCLQFDDELQTYTGFVNGKRDAYLECKEPSKSFCERVNATKDAMIAITGLGAGAVGGASVVTSAAGVTVVTHSSGAVILTGASGYISGTLGSIGAGSIAVLTAPATAATAVISVVAVGGAVYFCKE